MSLQSEVGKKPEKPVLEPLSKLYTPSPPIDTKFFNTPNRMAEVGWLPQWQLKEAVRELLANMIDQARTVAEKFISNTAVLEFTEEPGRFAVHVGTVLLAEAKWGSKKLKYVKTYCNAGTVKARAESNDYSYEKAQFLELINYTSALPNNSFYVGHSSKRNNLAAIGKHGEGLTGACVVLNRAGCNVIADCSHYAYQAHIVRLKNDVCFQLKRKRESLGPPQDTVRFMIVFDPRKPAEDIQELMNSVRLPSAATAAGITSARGTLLTEPALRGKQFNRSIYVGEDENCLFGYDFLDPDKTLLQGRDRNSHVKTSLVAECGAIISEAILQNEEVRKEVLKCFLYGPEYNPDGPGEGALKRYTDLKDGEGLTAAAIDALRQQYEQDLLPVGQKVVYCARDTTMLNEIKRMNGMVSAYCHRVLHNHNMIVFNFQTMLKRDAIELDPNTRVGALRDQLLDLLEVRELKQSVMDLPDAQIGIWKLGQVAYVTSVQSLGPANAAGFTEQQEVSITRTLNFAQIPVEKQVKIMRLLRNQPVVAETYADEEEKEEKIQQEENVADMTDAAVGEVATEEKEKEEETPVPEPAATAPAPADPAPVLAAAEEKEEDVLPVRAGVERTINGADEGDANAAATNAPASPAAVARAAAESKADEAQFSDIESDGEDYGEAGDHADDGAEDSDAFDLGSENSEDPDADDNDRRADNLPLPKRQRLVRAGGSSGTSSADTSVEVVDLSSDNLSVASVASRPPPQLLQDLPLEISLSGAPHSTVRQLRFFKPCGVWLYSDNDGAEEEMQELLNVCLPTYKDRYKLRLLSSLLHIVVFVTADKRAPPAFNSGPHSVCINLGACGNEQMFKYILHAQMQAVNLVE